MKGDTGEGSGRRAGGALAERASPTGPIVGYDLPCASGRPGEVEREVFREEGVDPEAFRAEHVRARGHRRPLRVPVREASLEVEDPHTVLVRFVLPPGSFATVLLEALMAGPRRSLAPGSPLPPRPDRRRPDHRRPDRRRPGGGGPG